MLDYTNSSYPVWQHTFVSPSAFSRRAVVSYWRKYVHEVLVNRLGGLSLPRKSVVRLTDRPDMTLDVYRGRKTTIQPTNTNSSKNFRIFYSDMKIDKGTYFYDKKMWVEQRLLFSVYNLIIIYVCAKFHENTF